MGTKDLLEVILVNLEDEGHRFRNYELINAVHIVNIACVLDNLTTNINAYWTDDGSGGADN